MKAVREVAIFKLVEFIVAVLSASVLFWLVPELAYVTDTGRSFLANLAGVLFVTSIFYFLLLFAPVSFWLFFECYVRSKSPLTLALVNAAFFLAYALLVIFIFSQSTVAIQLIGSALIISLILLLYGVVFLSAQKKLDSG